MRNLRNFLRHPLYFTSAWYSNLMYLHNEWLEQERAKCQESHEES